MTRRYSIAEFANFYTNDCDAHYLVAHLHQNMMEYNDWNMVDLHDELALRLFNHPGYPFKRKLQDSSFTQDKFAVNPHLGDFANTTIKIHFTSLDVNGLISPNFLIVY